MNAPSEQVAQPSSAAGDKFATVENEKQAVSLNANIPPAGAKNDNDNTESWKGDARYFQSGDKAGTLKPAARDPDNAKTKSKTFAGLNVADLKSTAPVVENIPVVDVKAEREKKKAEKKSSDARVGAKIAMRILDTMVKWISGGTYGKDFNAEQRAQRNQYAEELEADWREYLLTLDIPLHPALIVLFGSTVYVGDAFATDKGQEKVKGWKEKMFGKVGAALLSRNK